MHFVRRVPPGYEPDDGRWRRAHAAEETGAAVRIVHDPREAAEGADVLYTDVWTSMGQEDERERRLRDLDGYGIDAGLLGSGRGRRDRAPLPPRPLRRGDRRGRSLYGPQSAVWDEAENRLHSQKALLALIVR